MSTTNFSTSGSHTKSLQELLRSRSLVGGLQQQLWIFFVAVDISSPLRHLLGILSSSLPFPKNLPCIRRPNSYIVVRQPLIFWLGLFPSQCSLLGFRVSRKLEPLWLRIWRNQNHRLCIAFSDSDDDDDDDHKCGQTSRPDVGTEIQTNCNFEAHVYYFNYLLGF